MDKDKKILIFVIVCGLLFLLSGCFSEEINSDFPKDSEGYPERNIVLINGEKTELTDFKNCLQTSKMSHSVNAKIRKDGTVTIALPQGRPTNDWYIEEKGELKLISYRIKSLWDNAKEKPEGSSDEIQEFTFSIPQSNTVKFKWANINQSGKAFKDKEENYLLEVKISE